MLHLWITSSTELCRYALKSSRLSAGMANGTIMEVISSETAILYQFVPVYVVCIMNFMPKEHEVTKFRTDVALREKSSDTIFF